VNTCHGLQMQRKTQSCFWASSRRSQQLRKFLTKKMTDSKTALYMILTVRATGVNSSTIETTVDLWSRSKIFKFTILFRFYLASYQVLATLASTTKSTNKGSSNGLLITSTTIFKASFACSSGPSKINSS
jgi:hypothetical protein